MQCVCEKGKSAYTILQLCSLCVCERQGFDRIGCLKSAAYKKYRLVKMMTYYFFLLIFIVNEIVLAPKSVLTAELFLTSVFLTTFSFLDGFLTHVSRA